MSGNIIAADLVPRILADEAALGASAAELVLEGLRPAAAAGRRYVLGCPAGRSPRSTYRALAREAAAAGLNLSRVHLVMMDEFVAKTPQGWRLCPQNAHYSCRGFGEREIRQVLNEALPPARQVPAANLHAPSPRNPDAYERLIADLGGVDLFLLASGASDGHVAFNPPGARLGARTRVVELAQTTRQDNLGTFPCFKGIDEAPRFGVTVGPGSIVRWSQAAVMLLPGAAKGPALKRIMAGYDPAWPASIIHLCKRPAILADRAAWNAMETA